MKSLAEVLRLGRQIRSIGFDDAPFDHAPGSPVHLSGIVCLDTRMEGMLWGETTKDGHDATEVIAELLLQSKFHEQVHVVLLDGIAVGGFNIIDLAALADRLARPCIAVMRRLPDLDAIQGVLRRLPDADARIERLSRAGTIHDLGGFVFQVQGERPGVVARALARLTDRGRVPEPLRLAHLIGAAVKNGQSSRRA